MPQFMLPTQAEAQAALQDHDARLASTMLPSQADAQAALSQIDDMQGRQAQQAYTNRLLQNGDAPGWLPAGVRQGSLDLVGGTAGIPRLMTGNEHAIGSEFANAAAQSANEIEQQRGNSGWQPEGESWLGRQARGMTRSLTTMGEAMGIGKLTGIPGAPLALSILAAATSQANQSYNEARDAGQSHQEANAHARTQGAIEGGVTAAFNLVGMGGAETTLSKAFAKDFYKSISKSTLKEAGKSFLKTEGKELAEELTTNYLEALDAKLREVNPHALDEDQLTQLTIDTAVQTLGVSGVAFAPHATVAALNELKERRAKEAERQAQQPQPAATAGNAQQPVETPQWAQPTAQPAATQPQPQQQEPPGTPAPAPLAPQEAPNAAPPVEAPPRPAETQVEVPTPLQVPTEPLHNPPPLISTVEGENVIHNASLRPEVNQPTPEAPKQSPLEELKQREDLWQQRWTVKAQMREMKKKTAAGATKAFEAASGELDALIAARRSAGQQTVALTNLASSLKRAVQKGDIGETKAAYKAASREFHPDRNAGNPAAVESFRIVSEAQRTAENMLDKGAQQDTAIEARSAIASLKDIEGRLGIGHLTKEEKSRKAAEETPKAIARKRKAMEAAQVAEGKPETQSKQAAPTLPGAQTQLFGGSEAQGKLFNAASAEKPKVEPLAAKTESPADITIAQPTIEGQQPLIAEQKPVQPLEAKRQATLKKRAETNLFNKAEHNVLKVAAERKIDPEKMHDAVDRAIQTERQTWDNLKEAVGDRNPTPTQRKALREGDTESTPVRKLRLDEVRHALEDESGVLRHTGVTFEQVLDVLKHGMPPEPVATNRAFVDKVADEFAREQPREQPEKPAERGEAKDEDLPPNEPTEVAPGISFMKGEAPKVETAKPENKAYYKAAKKPEVEVSTEQKAANKESIRKGLDVEDKERTGPISVEDIRKTLERDFDTALLRGRVPPGAQGFYEWATHVGRVVGKEYQNLAVLSHEIGHHFENLHKPLKDAPADVKAEIETLDYEEERKDRKEALHEGFAEFFRHLLTTDIGPSLAPKTYSWFTEHYLPAHEDQRPALSKARRLIDDYRTQDPLDRASSSIYAYGQNPKALEVSKDEQLKEEIGRRLIGAAQAWYDQHFLPKQIAAKGEAARPGGVGLKTRFKDLVESYHRADRTQANEALNDGVYTLGEERRQLYKSFKEVMSPLDANELPLWSNYLRGLAAQEARDKKAGYNPGMTEEEADAAIAQVEKDGKTAKFDKVVQDFRGFHAALVDVAADSGIISQDSAERIKKSRDVYMPIYRNKDTGLRNRVFSKFHDVTSGIFGVKSPIHKLGQGSNDPVLDPIDATIIRTQETYNAANHQEMKKAFMAAIIPSFGGARGFGKWAVEVGPKLVKDSVKLEKILDSLTQEHEVNGVVRDPLITEFEAKRIKKVTQLREGRITRPLLKWFKKHYGSEDVDALKDATQGVWSLQEAVAFWKQDFGSSPSEHIDQFYHNGELHLIQYVDGDLYKVVQGLNSRFESSTVGKSLAGVLSWYDKLVTSPVKLGAVALNPSFQPVNFIRDYASFITQSKETGAWERLYKPMEGLYKYAAYYLAGRKNPYAEVFDAMGGKVSPRLGTREKQVQHIRGEMLAKSKGQLLVAKFKWGNIINSVQDALSVGESGVRLAEFEAAIKNDGFHYDAKKDSWVNTDSGKAVDFLPRRVVTRASSAANEVTTNFRRRGSASAVVDRVVPFFGANVAGTVRGIIGAKELLSGPGLRKRQLGMAMLMGFGAIAWALGHDEDWYKDLDPDMKNRFWIFGLPGGSPWLRIPKPYTYSAFVNTMEGLLDWSYTGKADRFPEIIKSEIESQMPPGTKRGVRDVAGLGTAWDLAVNEDRFGRKIEPQSMQESGLFKEYRTKPYTTETAKFISSYLGGAKLGLSPIQIDYIADQWTGGGYSQLTGLGEAAVKGDLRADSAPVTKRFLMRSDHQQTVHNFYEQYGELTAAVATDKYLSPDKPDAVKVAQLQQWTRYKSVLADIWKADKDATIDERRDMERYAIGLSDYALGNPERARYPNPLRKDEKLPGPIEEARADYVGKLYNALTASPARKPGEAFPKFRDRFMQASIERKWAAAELKRLDYKPMDVAMTANKKLLKQGHRLSAQSAQEVFQAMAAKP